MPPAAGEPTIADMPVRVLIVDPQPFFAEAVAAALDDDERLEVVGWTADAEEAYRLMSSFAPDVTLCELGMASGSESGLLHRAPEGSRIVVSTRGHVGDALLSVAEAGAVGCIGHDTDLTALRSLMTEAADGRFVVDPYHLGEALRRARASAPEERAADLRRLTSREREILDLLTQGFDDPAIAKRLQLSSHTVRTHVGNILRKMGVRSRAEAVRVALRTGTGDAPVSILRIEGPSLGES